MNFDITITRFKKVAIGLGVTSMLALSVVGAGAADSVTQAVNAGTRTASVADLALSAVDYSHTAQSQTGTMTLTADDSTGSNAGWNVTIQTSAFVWSAGSGGASSGTNIAATNFSLTSAATPVSTAGEAVDLTNGPKAVDTSGTLDMARKTVNANAGFGNGTYTQDLGVDLTIPAQSAAGTYTGTLTTTISSAP